MERESEKLPKFASERWYSDPQDHRCPQNSWLEALEISEPASGDRSERRRTVITLKLLGAYHDGWITFAYSDVRRHSVTCYQCDQGAGNWLRDEFAIGDAGFIVHRITWLAVAGSTSQWVIEARDVTYTWSPKNA